MQFRSYLPSDAGSAGSFTFQDWNSSDPDATSRGLHVATIRPALFRGAILFFERTKDMPSINKPVSGSNPDLQVPGHSDGAASNQPDNSAPIPLAEQTGASSAAAARPQTSTLRRLVSLPAMRLRKQDGSTSPSKPEESRQVIESKRPSETQVKAGIDKEQRDATLREAAELVRDKINDKYSVRLPVSVAEKLIILKYFTHNVWSKRKIAGRLITGPDKPPTPPGDAESSEKAKEEFIRRMAERKKEMEARRLWQEGLADEPVAADFGDTLGLDINGDDAVRASLEELIRLSASGHPDIEPLALNIANASAVDALLSENLPDWSRAPMKGGLAEHSQKLRKARSSVELRTGAGSINTQGKDNAGGTSGNRPTVGRDRHDPRYPDAPPVPPLPANNG